MGSSKSLPSAPWNTYPTVALMATHMATGVPSAMRTCKYRSETLPVTATDAGLIFVRCFSLIVYGCVLEISDAP